MSTLKERMDELEPERRAKVEQRAHDLSDLEMQTILVSKEEYDALVRFLEAPPAEPNEKLKRLLREPSIFESD